MGCQLFSPVISLNFEANQLSIEIITERLYIHSYRIGDFENCVALYGDKRLTKYFDHQRPRSRGEVQSLIEEKGFKYFYQGLPFGLFSIFDKKDMGFVGQADLIPTIDPEIVEIGVILHREYHGTGYALEATETLLKPFVNELNRSNYKYYDSIISKVIATCHPDNYASQKLMRKMGMMLEKSQERFGNPRLWFAYIPK